MELCFDPKLKPYLLKLNELFVSYKLVNVLSLKSKYAIRLYEILKSFEFKAQGYETILLKDLKHMLNIGDKEYPRYYDFKLRVLAQAQKELQSKTDIRFDFTEVRKSRRIVAIKFYIQPNKNVIEEEDKSSLHIESEVIKEDPNEGKYIKKVKKIMAEKDITSVEAKNIYDSSNGNMELIKKVYNHFKNKELDSIVGAMISMVRPGVFQEPKGNTAKNAFTDYEQREYDYEALEKKLLGIK